jgi:hypothetical protein
VAGGASLGHAHKKKGTVREPITGDRWKENRGGVAVTQQRENTGEGVGQMARGRPFIDTCSWLQSGGSEALAYWREEHRGAAPMARGRARQVRPSSWRVWGGGSKTGPVGPRRCPFPSCLSGVGTVPRPRPMVQ